MCVHSQLQIALQNASAKYIEAWFTYKEEPTGRPRILEYHQDSRDLSASTCANGAVVPPRKAKTTWCGHRTQVRSFPPHRLESYANCAGLCSCGCFLPVILLPQIVFWGWLKKMCPKWPSKMETNNTCGLAQRHFEPRSLDSAQDALPENAVYSSLVQTAPRTPG